MIHNFCYFNGKIIPLSKAYISLDDLGILRGYGAFDFSRTYNGKPFHLKDQFARFKNSAKSIGLSVPISQKEFEEVLYQLLKKNKLKDASFRAVITGGRAASDMISGSTPTFYILVEPAYSLPDSLYKKGVKLVPHNYMRYVPEAKTTNYIEAARLQKEKKKQGAFEILYTSDNKVFECASSNFFLIKGNTLITAKNNVLPGITRRIILSLAQPHFVIEEREVGVDELATAHEAFVTGANKKVLGVVKIGNVIVGNGVVGEKTKLLKRLFDEYTTKW